MREKKTTSHFLFLLPALGVLWKYAVARQDGHIIAVMFVIIPIAVMYYLYIQKRSSVHGYVLITLITVSFLAVLANKIPFYGYYGFSQIVMSPIQRVYDAQFVHFFNISESKRQWAVLSAAQLGGARLPDSMKRQIGDDGVDIFPWETSIVAANNLTWRGRPSPFSFETYSPYLDNLNARFFNSKKSPRFVVWHATTQGTYGIDYRNVVWDEPDTMKSLLKNYSVNQSNKNFILLEKRSQSRQLVASTQNIGTIEEDGRWRNIDTGDKINIGFVSFRLAESIQESTKTLLLRGDAHYIQVKTMSGKTFKYRYVVDNSTQGLLIEGLPTDWPSIVDMFDRQGMRANNRIISYRFISKP